MTRSSMMVLLPISVFMLLVTCGQSPVQPDWAEVFSNPNSKILVTNDYNFGSLSNWTGFEGLALDSVGNTYVCGHFEGTGNLDPGDDGTVECTSRGNNDAFVSKIDSDLAWQWTYHFGGPGFEACNHMAIAGSDDIYLVGAYEDGAKLAPASQQAEFPSVGEADVFIMHLNSQGIVQWIKTWGSELDDTANSIATDDAGDLYVACSIYGNSVLTLGPNVHNLHGPGSFIIKLSSAGDILWAQALKMHISDIKVDSRQGIYLGGCFEGTVDLRPTYQDNIASPDGTRENAFIMKLDESGKGKWVQTLSLDLDTGINAIAVDGDDNIYATGAFQTLAAAQLEGTHDLAAELVFSDVFVSKFGEQGPIWIRTFGGSDTDEGTAIAVDPHGGVYVAGGFSGQVDFNPGEGIDLHKSISCEWRSFLSSSSDPVLIKQDSLDEYVGSTDAFLSKLDTSGNFIWAQTWGGNEWDSPGGVVVDSDGRIRVAGTLGHGGFLREFGADGIRTR